MLSEKEDDSREHFLRSSADKPAQTEYESSAGGDESGERDRYQANDDQDRDYVP